MVKEKELEGQECSDKDCNNKSYAYNNLTQFFKVPVCRKHYYMYNFGYSEYEASKK